MKSFPPASSSRPVKSALLMLSLALAPSAPLVTAADAPGSQAAAPALHEKAMAKRRASLNVTRELLNKILITPKLIHDPMPAYGKRYLPFAMSSSTESTAKGRLWTCWAGGEDGPDAFVVTSYSDDQGRSWRDPVFVIDPQAQGHKEMGTRLGTFWCDPKGRLWLFFHQSLGMFDGSCSNWYVRCDNPDAEKPVWGEPVYIGYGASLTKPIVRQNGEWILPVSLWERWHIDPAYADCYHELDSVRGSNVFVSTNEGANWTHRGGIIFQDSNFNEHSIVELGDGTLWMLNRNRREAAHSFSRDGGRTWTPQTTAFPDVNSKAQIRRLKSGKILLVRHGEDLKKAAEKREHLTAFLLDFRRDNEEDARYFAGRVVGKLVLDERAGVSYPDISEGPDGTLYIHYDFDRYGAAEILLARVREDDLLAGKVVAPGSALRNVVKSKHGMNHGSMVSAGTPEFPR
jgi:sialidase-1